MSGLARAANRRLADLVYGLSARIEDLDRRLSRAVLEATVTAVDAAAGTARVKFDGDLPSAEMPFTDAAGAVSTFFPLTPGERVVVVSPNGDLARGQIMRGGRTAAHGAPHDQAGEAAIAAGATRIVIAPDGIRITGDVAIDGSLAVTGGGVSNEGKDIGSTHRHGGVTPGPGASGEPV